MDIVSSLSEKSPATEFTAETKPPRADIRTTRHAMARTKNKVLHLKPTLYVSWMFLIRPFISSFSPGSCVDRRHKRQDLLHCFDLLKVDHTASVRAQYRKPYLRNQAGKYEFLRFYRKTYIKTYILLGPRAKQRMSSANDLS